MHTYNLRSRVKKLYEAIKFPIVEKPKLQEVSVQTDVSIEKETGQYILCIDKKRRTYSF